MRKFTDMIYYNDYDAAQEIENSVLLPREVMDYLACGRSTFYKLVNSGTLKAFRVGNQWRVTRENLIAFSAGTQL